MSLASVKFRRTLLLGASALGALVLTVATSNTAQADPRQAECSTTGAYGYVYADWYNPVTRLDFSMTIYDSKADGYKPGVRLITTDVDGVRKNWPWHYNTGGNNTSVDLHSYASNQSGIFSWGVQVGRFDGSNNLLNSCTNWI